MPSVRQPKPQTIEPLEQLQDRSGSKWIETMPEYMDSSHMNRLYPSDNEWGIPTVKTTDPANLPENLLAYRDPAPPETKEGGLLRWAIHFYLDDYRFTATWTRPWRTLDYLNRRTGFLITPDFSVTWDMPAAMKIWNVYRNRWCGAFWNENGAVAVIPSISWAGPDTYPYAFSGIPHHSVVAIRGIGKQPDGLEWKRWLPGYRAMLDTLVPSRIIVYGQLPSELDNPIHRFYETRWMRIQNTARQTHRNKRNRPSALELLTTD